MKTDKTPLNIDKLRLLEDDDLITKEISVKEVSPNFSDTRGILIKITLNSEIIKEDIRDIKLLNIDRGSEINLIYSIKENNLEIEAKYSYSLFVGKYLLKINNITIPATEITIYEVFLKLQNINCPLINKSIKIPLYFTKSNLPNGIIKSAGLYDNNFTSFNIIHNLNVEKFSDNVLFLTHPGIDKKGIYKLVITTISDRTITVRYDLSILPTNSILKMNTPFGYVNEVNSFIIEMQNYVDEGYLKYFEINPFYGYGFNYNYWSFKTIGLQVGASFPAFQYPATYNLIFKTCNSDLNFTAIMDVVIRPQIMKISPECFEIEKNFNLNIEFTTKIIDGQISKIELIDVNGNILKLGKIISNTNKILSVDFEAINQTNVYSIKITDFQESKIEFAINATGIRLKFTDPNTLAISNYTPKFWKINKKFAVKIIFNQLLFNGQIKSLNFIQNQFNYTTPNPLIEEDIDENNKAYSIISGEYNFSKTGDYSLKVIDECLREYSHIDKLKILPIFTITAHPLTCGIINKNFTTEITFDNNLLQKEQIISAFYEEITTNLNSTVLIIDAQIDKIELNKVTITSLIDTISDFYLKIKDYEDTIITPSPKIKIIADLKFDSIKITKYIFSNTIALELSINFKPVNKYDFNREWINYFYLVLTGSTIEIKATILSIIGNTVNLSVSNILSFGVYEVYVKDLCSNIIRAEDITIVKSLPKITSIKDRCQTFIDNSYTVFTVNFDDTVYVKYFKTVQAIPYKDGPASPIPLTFSLFSDKSLTVSTPNKTPIPVGVYTIVFENQIEVKDSNLINYNSIVSTNKLYITSSRETPEIIDIKPKEYVIDNSDSASFILTVFLNSRIEQNTIIQFILISPSGEPLIILNENKVNVNGNELKIEFDSESGIRNITELGKYKIKAVYTCNFPIKLKDGMNLDIEFKVKVDSIDPIKPIGPIEIIHPKDPVDINTKPIDPVDIDTKPIDPVEPDGPVEPNPEPVEPDDPIDLTTSPSIPFTPHFCLPPTEVLNVSPTVIIQKSKSESVVFTIMFGSPGNNQNINKIFLQDNLNSIYSTSISTNQQDPNLITALAYDLPENFYTVVIVLCNEKTLIAGEIQVDLQDTINNIVFPDPTINRRCLEGYVYDENVSRCVSCKDTNKFYYSSQCLDSCPFFTKVYSDSICVVSCEVFNLFSINQICVEKCPTGLNPDYNFNCVDCLAIGGFLLNDNCLEFCPSGFIITTSARGNECIEYINPFVNEDESDLLCGDSTCNGGLCSIKFSTIHCECPIGNSGQFCQIKTSSYTTKVIENEIETIFSSDTLKPEILEKILNLNYILNDKFKQTEIYSNKNVNKVFSLAVNQLDKLISNNNIQDLNILSLVNLALNFKSKNTQYVKRSKVINNFDELNRNLQVINSNTTEGILDLIAKTNKYISSFVQNRQDFNTSRSMIYGSNFITIQIWFDEENSLIDFSKDAYGNKIGHVECINKEKNIFDRILSQIEENTDSNTENNSTSILKTNSTSLFYKIEYSSSLNKFLHNNNSTQNFSNLMYLDMREYSTNYLSKCKKVLLKFPLSDQMTKRVNLELHQTYYNFGVDVYNKNDPSFNTKCHSTIYDKNGKSLNFDSTLDYRRYRIFQNMTFSCETLSNLTNCQYEGIEKINNSTYYINCICQNNINNVGISGVSYDYKFAKSPLEDFSNDIMTCQEVLTNFSLISNNPGLYISLFLLISMIISILLHPKLFKSYIINPLKQHEALVYDNILQKEGKVHFYNMPVMIDQNGNQLESDEVMKTQNETIKDEPIILNDIVVNVPKIEKLKKNKNFCKIFYNLMFEYHPILSLSKNSLMYPFGIKMCLFFFNILMFFTFNAFLFNEDYITMRIYNENRASFFYPIVNESGKIIVSILISYSIIYLIKLSLCITFTSKLEFSQNILNSTIEEKTKLCFEFYNRMYIRYIITWFYILSLAVFFLYYNILFCAVYPNSSSGWVYSGIWSMIAIWIFVSPFLLFLRTICEVCIDK